MIYFSIDYRSPPSGMGQIIDTRKPEKVINKLGNEVYNFTLVSYSGCGSENDPNYILTAYFNSREAEEQGWEDRGPIVDGRGVGVALSDLRAAACGRAVGEAASGGEDEEEG